MARRVVRRRNQVPPATLAAARVPAHRAVPQRQDTTATERASAAIVTARVWLR